MINPGYTRRQEFACTLDELNIYASAVLYEHEVLYVKQADGTYAVKIGDGVTPVGDLPYVINYSEIHAVSMQALAARDEARAIADGIGVVQTTGDSATAVMSQKAVTEEFSELKETISDLENFVIEESENKYNPSLQTEDTISPHYYVNGVPYESTQFDDRYNCTAPIPIKANTEYTIGTIPAVGGYTIPWGSASSGVFFYKEDDTYISGASTQTFTTPSETAYIRFNYWIGNGITLEQINSKCVIVEGDTLPTTYKPYYKDIKGLKKANLYTYENGVLTVYQNGTVWEFKKHGNNNIMMCSKYGVIGNVLSLGTDILSPYIVLATNNVDGDRETDSFTGGNHSYKQTSGTPTAETTAVKVLVDNQLASSVGTFNTLKLYCRHEVQASNTCKVDGTGRSVLVEEDFFEFDGKKLNVEVHITPTEQIKISTYYGLQLANLASYTGYTDVIRGNRSGQYGEVPQFVEGVNGTCKIRMHIDEIGLGANEYNQGVYKYQVANGKAYHHLIGNETTFESGIGLFYKGYYDVSLVN